MLVELHIENLGVIERASLALGAGMTALTGETGAGKTMLVEAIELLVGGRADASMVRVGATEARVDGRFVVERPGGSDEIVLSRVVPADGRSRAYVNGRPATAATLADEARDLVEDAKALEQAGSSALLIEATPAEVSQRIVDETSVPVIGCGAGPACHGQIVVLQDLLGLTTWQPSFANPVMHLGEPLIAAAQKWIDRVHEKDLGEHPYKMTPEEAGKL